MSVTGLLVTVLLLLCAAGADAVKDLIAQSWFKYIKDKDGNRKYSDWWVKADSQHLKYKDVDGDGIGDALGGKGKAAFFGAKTILVWRVDGWHRFKMFTWLFLFAALVSVGMSGLMINWWADYLILSTGFKIGFELFYRLIKKVSK